MSPPAHQPRNVKASGVSLVNKEATGGTTSSREVLGPEGREGREGRREGGREGEDSRRVGQDGEGCQELIILLWQSKVFSARFKPSSPHRKGLS